MLRLTALILLFIGGLQGYGQDRKGYYQAEIGGGVTADRLPFWLHTNPFGKITYDTYLWGTVGVGTPFSKSDTRAFDYSFGFEGTGALGRKEHRIFIDQLHGFYTVQPTIFCFFYTDLSSHKSMLRAHGQTKVLFLIDGKPLHFLPQHPIAFLTDHICHHFIRQDLFLRLKASGHIFCISRELQIDLFSPSSWDPVIVDGKVFPPGLQIDLLHHFSRIIRVIKRPVKWSFF